MTTPMSFRYPLRLATGAVLCLLLVSCADSSDQAASPSTPITSSTPSPTATNTPGNGTFLTPRDANRTNADSTAETAALMLHSWDTTTDKTQTAAAIRAKPLMSDEWAARQVAPERNAAQGEWLTPAEHHAYSQPVLTPAAGEMAAKDYGPNKAAKYYTVTWTWKGRDGVTIPADTSRQVDVYLEKHGKQWEVVGHQTRPVPGTSTIKP